MNTKLNKTGINNSNEFIIHIAAEALIKIHTKHQHQQQKYPDLNLHIADRIRSGIKENKYKSCSNYSIK